MRGILIFFLVLLLFGCTEHRVDESISKYREAAPQIKVGDSREKVLTLLQPTQQGLPEECSKRPERYLENGVREIYYFRSSRQPDGMTTDDEFTPYIFQDDKLVGIGWPALAKLDHAVAAKTLVNVP